MLEQEPLGQSWPMCLNGSAMSGNHGELRQTSHANWLAPLRLRERIRFFEMMFTNAEQAGVSCESADRVHFTRWVFATARQCAAVGLTRKPVAAWHSPTAPRVTIVRPAKGFRAFSLLSSTLGFRFAGQLAQWVPVLETSFLYDTDAILRRKPATLACLGCRWS